MQHRENESITYGIQKTRRDTVAARHSTVLCTPTEITSGSDNIPLAVDCMLLSRHILYIFPSVFFLTFSTKSLLLIRVKRSIKTAGMVVLACRYSDVDRRSSRRTMRGARVKLLLHFFQGSLVRAYTYTRRFRINIYKCACAQYKQVLTQGSSFDCGCYHSGLIFILQ